ncbi:MAG: hypothetical protein E6J90_27165 [Deltaproteobacteria bacterium]|nr:MAG: hypothetical protein E6J90_27165 [Deltaproteobacteria bacterium]TMQ17297.1 MAG: hypothetical protein E6J91_10465 [Deltaproteobacteria bacterium]
MEAIIHSAGNVARIDWKPLALLAAAIAARALALRRKHVIVSILAAARCEFAAQAALPGFDQGCGDERGRVSTSDPAGSISLRWRDMMNRDYYNRRVGKEGGPPRLTLVEVASQIEAAYGSIEEQGYLQRSFGYDCVDAGEVAGLHGTDLRMELYLHTGIKITKHVGGGIKEADEDTLFTLIEFIHDHVAKPADGEGYFHSYSGCGLHLNCRSARFDESAARKEWRDKINRPLKFYDGGYQLSNLGEIVRIAPDGMAKLIVTKLSPSVSNTDLAKVENAVRTFHLGRSTREQRKQAVRDLVDVLEFHRAAVKTHLSKDEGDLFNIANNFALRHHRFDQKDDYDDAWLGWLFYVYLSTVHLVLGRVTRHEAFSSDPEPPMVSTPETDDDELPF